MTGLSAPTIRRYRNGESTPTKENWKLLFKIFPSLQSSLRKETNLSNINNRPIVVTETKDDIRKNRVELDNYSPLEILNYIHLNIKKFKEEPLFRLIEKEAISVYKESVEEKVIEELFVKSLKKYLDDKKNN